MKVRYVWQSGVGAPPCADRVAIQLFSLESAFAMLCAPRSSWFGSLGCGDTTQKENDSKYVLGCAAHTLWVA